MFMMSTPPSSNVSFLLLRRPIGFFCGFRIFIQQRRPRSAAGNALRQRRNAGALLLHQGNQGMNRGRQFLQSQRGNANPDAVYLFSKSGFTERLESAAGGPVTGVGLDALTES